MRLGRAAFRLPAPDDPSALTVLYGLVFLVTGAVLLTIGYVLVRHNLTRRPTSGASFAGSGSRRQS